MQQSAVSMCAPGLLYTGRKNVPFLEQFFKYDSEYKKLWNSINQFDCNIETIMIVCTNRLGKTKNYFMNQIILATEKGENISDVLIYSYAQ